jgi:Ca2+-binding RTX toxin-like protein
MTSRSTPRLVSGLIAGGLSLILVPSALAGTASVNGTVLQITAAANENNIITVERLPDETVDGPTGDDLSRQAILVRDATNPQTSPVPGLPDQIGAILTPGVGCQPVADPNSTRTALKCTAASFTKIDADLSTPADQSAEANEPTRDRDFFSEADLDGVANLQLPSADVTGGAGRDTLRGTSAGDVLDAGTGNDELYGLAGDDQVLPGPGKNDPVSGGPGSDTISYASSTVRVVVTLDGQPNDGEAGNDNVLADMENITTGAGNDLVVAANNNNTIVTGLGNDEVRALGGDDSISAGEGDNVVDAGDGKDSGSSGAGLDRVTLGTGDDTFNVGAGDNVVDAGEGKDDVTAAGGNDRLDGFGGDDTLRGGDGENVLSGDLGVDDLSGGTGVDRANGGDGNDKLTLGGGNNFAEGGAGDDAITTLGGNDDINGGAGADTIGAGDGANKIDGGSENDGITSGAGIDLVFGGSGDDTITTGGENDRVQGNLGADTMNLGDGNADHVDYLDRVNNVYADLNNVASGEGCFGGGVCENDKITNTERLTGGDGNDRLVGNGGANALTGGKGDVDNNPATTDGDDDLRGGLGADELTGGDGYDQVSYRDRVNGVTVTLDGQAGDGESGENDNVKGDIEKVEGGGGNDSLTGSDQRNDLYGLAGDDVLDGKLGPDLMEGGANEDTVTYANRPGDVTVVNDGTVAEDGEAGEGDNVGPDVENLTGGNGNDKLTTVDVGGVGVANKLRGGAGNDLLDGGYGSDDLYGGLDRDQVAYTNRPATEVVIYQEEGGRNDGTGIIDPAIFDANCPYSGTHTSTERDLIAEDVEGIRGGGESDVFIATGISGADFVGGDGRDVLKGSSLPDLLNGGGGDDFLCGGADDDVLVGGAGADVLNGQADNDRAVDFVAGTDTAQGIEGFGGDASLPAFQTAPQQQPAQTQATTASQPTTSSSSTASQPTSSGSTTTSPTTSSSSTTSQPTSSGSTSKGSGTTTSGSGSTTGGSTGTQETVTRVVPVGTVAGSTEGSRSLKSIKTAKSGSKTVARVRGTVAERSCKRGQTIRIKVLDGRKVVGTKTAKLGKGCTFNALVPVRTKAKRVNATVSLVGTTKSLRAR